MDLRGISTAKLLMELSTRENLIEILVVNGKQDFKVKIGSTLHEFEGPANIIIVEKN